MRPNGSEDNKCLLQMQAKYRSVECAQHSGIWYLHSGGCFGVGGSGGLLARSDLPS